LSSPRESFIPDFRVPGSLESWFTGVIGYLGTGWHGCVLKQPKQSKSLRKRESKAEMLKQESRERLRLRHRLGPTHVPIRTEQCVPRQEAQI
jgi:hypothetical protein